MTTKQRFAKNDPELAQLLEERWHAITVDVVRLKDETGWSEVNSKAWRRLDDALKYLAVRMVGKVDDDDLLGLTEDIHELVRGGILTWAAPIVAADLNRRDAAVAAAAARNSGRSDRRQG